MTEKAYPKMYLYRRIVQAKLFIDRHYDSDIDLDNIADEAYFSKFHFIRLFKKTYGRSPNQYLQHVRIENAKKLLGRNTSVTETCLAVGFESVSSFTALFKRLTGLTPSVFQENSLRKQEATRKAPLNYIPGCFAEFNSWK